MKPIYNIYIEAAGEKTTGRMYAKDKDMTSFTPAPKYILDLKTEEEALELVERFKNVLDLKVAKFV